jgi:glucosamine-6-phosphate deaminase
MSETAADIVAGAVSGKRVNLGLATGSTPEGMYDCLSKLCSEGKCDFSGVTTFNLDEYYPIKSDDPQSYRYFMDKHLFDRVNIDKKSTFIPDGSAQEPEKECAEYEKKIAAHGGVDLQVIGIGPNGHIGFNEPDDDLYPLTHITKLSKRTLEANSRFFRSADEMPKRALTMGMKTILSAKKILVLANGAVKHEPISRLLEGKINTKCPVTLLNLHNDVTLVCDKEAYYGK